MCIGLFVGTMCIGLFVGQIRKWNAPKIRSAIRLRIARRIHPSWSQLIPIDPSWSQLVLNFKKNTNFKKKNVYFFNFFVFVLRCFNSWKTSPAEAFWFFREKFWHYFLTAQRLIRAQPPPGGCKFDLSDAFSGVWGMAFELTRWLTKTTFWSQQVVAR